MVSNFVSCTLNAIQTQPLRLHFLFHLNAERHTDHVLWTHLTLFAHSPAIKVQLCSTSSLSSKPPDAGICSLRSIAVRCLQLQHTLRSGGTAPQLAKGQLNLDHVTLMSIDGSIAIRRFQHNVSLCRSSTHSIAGTTMRIYSTGSSWRRGSPSGRTRSRA